MPNGHWDDEAFDSDEYEDLPDDAPAETLSCPECGVEIYEEAEQCPACGWYVIHSTSEWSSRSWWWIALGLTGIIAVIFVLLYSAWN